MKEVQNLGPADPRKEILVAARKADDLVGKRGSKDHEFIVLQCSAVDPNLHFHLKKTSSQIPDFAGANLPYLNQGLVIIPRMVQKSDLGIRILLFGQRQIQPLANRLLTHRRMGS